MAGTVEVNCNGGIALNSSQTSNWCNRAIRLTMDKNGKVKQVARANSANNESNVNRDAAYNSQTTRTRTTTTEIYEEVLRVVRSSNNIDEEKKAQAEDVLDYVKTYAPYFLPVVADGIKKVFYL